MAAVMKKPLQLHEMIGKASFAQVSSAILVSLGQENEEIRL